MEKKEKWKEVIDCDRNRGSCHIGKKAGESNTKSDCPCYQDLQNKRFGVFFCPFERKVISKTKWSVIQYMKEILEVLDHRERAESIVSWSGLHLKYNAIFFYVGT